MASIKVNSVRSEKSPVEFQVRPGHEVEAVRREPGNLLLLSYRIGGEPVRHYIHEVYADEAAFQAYLRSAHNRDFNAGLKRAAIPLRRTDAPIACPA